ncbi:MAG: thioredoxin family protein [Ginsengibacter sp.]
MINLLLSVLFSIATFSPPNWTTNMDAAKNTAKTENKYILLNFSGSDWCIPCMKLEQDVFNSSEFIQYSNANLVLVNADFPRKSKNKLSKEQQKLNDALADKYNPQGSFPFTLLLDAEGNKIKIWDGYYKDGPQSFIAEIKEITGKN